MHRESVETPAGTITLETGAIARQADGAVILRHGETVLLATAVAAEAPREGTDFFPLTVEYRERLAASGRIPGAYLRREGRITDSEVLASRLVDRTVRPLFPGQFLNETQVLVTVLSADEELEPDAIAIPAAGAALHVSGIPWDGPAAGVRVARVHGQWRFFPSPAERAAAELDLVVSSRPGGLIMVEGQAREAGEALVAEALERGDRFCRELCGAIERLRAAAGQPKRELAAATDDAALAERVASLGRDAIEAAAGIAAKKERRAALRAAARELAARLEQEGADPAAVTAAVEDLQRRVIRGRILGEGRRPDGRGPADIRPISCEVGWLPRNHGSAVFTRGETQVLASCTLGTASDEQAIETLAGQRKQRFLLHYNFPPYSVGEVRALRGPGRREIGHGNLAHRALEPVLPAVDEFPYTIRIVSDVAESNGSSSMATVCGGCLALMDAGVPISRPVAGIAMGLVAEGDRVVVLSDILGDEDHLGDMDFKVAGTREGITAIQMDNKLGSVPREVLEAALEQARAGRLHVLSAMEPVLAAPRPELSARAPRVLSLRIRPERIRDLIGPGGRNIQEIQSVTGTKVDVDDEGLVRVYATDAAAAAEALRRVRHVTFEPEVGGVYRGEVIVVQDFFAVVRLGATIEGRLHVSELDTRRVGKVGDVLRVGEQVIVRVLGVDRMGKIALSRKAAFGSEPES
ncbi:MAG: polyribonucleotide nucleotidyltransferase [Acidobacteria bacterium]|nr:polyribonucleotide nucleotidyltransferase [Acidobacteriota bacterium]